MQQLLLCAAVVLAVLAPLCSSAGTDGTLYALTMDVNLETIDPVTGKTRTLGPTFPSELVAQNLAAVDGRAGKYYILGYNDSTTVISLISLDLKTGVIDSEIALPFISSPLIGVGEAVDVDESNGEIFAVGYLTDGKHHIFRINPRSATLKKLATIGDLDVLGAAHGFDVSNDLLWLQYAVNTTGIIKLELFGFDARDGSLRHRYSERSVKDMETLRWDKYGNQMVGFAVDASGATLKRTLVSLKVDNGRVAVKTIGQVSDNYVLMQAGINAINSKQRQIYGLMQQGNGNMTQPFDLIAVDITDGTVLNHVPFCNTPATGNCPWSIEFVQSTHV